MNVFDDAVRQLLTLPRGRQQSRIAEILADFPAPEQKEEWNTRFGPGSLFDAWTQSRVAKAIYRRNAQTIREFLAERQDWSVIEVGAGDGRLWSQVFDKNSRGTLHVIDPVPEAHEQVTKVVPQGVELRCYVSPAQETIWPEADLVVCSLTLHHVPGADQQQCIEHGLKGPGKLEVLQSMAGAIKAREGLIILNEADVFCDLGLLPGDPILADRLIDSYVRRCARSLLDDIAEQGDDDLCQRWRLIMREWCLGQIRMADVPVSERDVYELDVPRWVTLIERAGLTITDRHFTDTYGLFHRYLMTVAP